jgi:hypothetical protein
MSEALMLLQQARRHMVSSEIDMAMQKIVRFETILLSGDICREQANLCINYLLSIKALSEAINSGVSAARYQIEEMSSLSRKLTVYNKSGILKSSYISKKINPNF